MENKFCEKCGAALEIGAKFCTNCGAKIENEVNTINVVTSDENNNTINSGIYQSISRAQIKEQAKEIYKNNMWNIWKVILIVAGISAVGVLVANKFSILSLVISLMIAPLTVGETYYLINLVSGKEFKIDQLFEFYKKNMWQIILATVLVGLFTMLWSFLFIIPGIIAAISYSMVTYLYADGETEEATQVIKKSKLLMNGYKMDYFVFQLSFIGWFLLCGLTLGILYIWIIPYYTVANILFLKKIKEIRS